MSVTCFLKNTESYIVLISGQVISDNNRVMILSPDITFLQCISRGASLHFCDTQFASSTYTLLSLLHSAFAFVIICYLIYVSESTGTMVFFFMEHVIPFIGNTYLHLLQQFSLSFSSTELKDSFHWGSVSGKETRVQDNEFPLSLNERK